MSSDWNSVGENIRVKKTAGLAQADPVKQAFTSGYQTGYETAQKEVLERMKTWLVGKEEDSNGEDKDHEKSPG